MWASKYCKATLFSLGFAMAQLGTVQAQSLGVADIGNIQRDIQSIDQVYALAPSIIAGEYPMSSTRAGIVPTAQTTRTNASIVAANADFQRQAQEPILEPLAEINWVWIGTTAVASLLAGATYLIMRPQ